jgi:hypothetical protein
MQSDQLTSPTPAQLPAVAVSLGHIVCIYMGGEARGDLGSDFFLGGGGGDFGGVFGGDFRGVFGG